MCVTRWGAHAINKYASKIITVIFFSNGIFVVVKFHVIFTAKLHVVKKKNGFFFFFKKKSFYKNKNPYADKKK
jgi:hypothetical protein